MPTPVSPDAWLDIIHREYLSDYINSGWFTVKFISGDSPSLSSVQTRLHALVEDESYFHVHLDAAKFLPDDKKPDLHRIDRFFFAITESVDWRARTTTEARKYLESRGVVVQQDRELKDLDGIAQDNGRTTADLINQFQRELVTGYIKDQGLALEFRTAISALVRAQLLPDAMTPTTEEVLLAWLAGRTMPGAAAALKKIRIFERITRANARRILASFCRWLPRAGHGGLVVTFDFRPYEHKNIPRTRRQADTLRALVFSQFTDGQFGVEMVARALRAFHPVTFTGAMSAKQRSDAVRAFRSDQRRKAMILSLRAGGMGLNLQSASYVFHLDRWWNPAIEDQAESRAHRRGQPYPVTAFRYVCADTIEERIEAILREKRHIFKEFVDDVTLDLRRVLTAEDVFGLFGLHVPRI